jgi:CDP-diacylglycerol--serine O-phosphatidyltransferase
MKIFTIPKLLTCCHLLCGCIGITAVYHSDLILAAWLIILAGVFDFLDGFVARLLNSASAIGKELDSLADVVTFGVLPACILSYYLTIAIPSINEMWITYLAFILAIFSALRLAKFNIDTRQSESFIGLPTPANGLVVASLPLIIQKSPELSPYIINQTHLLIYIAVFSFLLISEIPLFALKFKKFTFEGNEIRYIFIILTLILIVLLGVTSIPLIVLVYFILSAVKHFFFTKTQI